MSIVSLWLCIGCILYLSCLSRCETQRAKGQELRRDALILDDGEKDTRPIDGYFLKSCVEGDLALVKQALVSGANMECRDPGKGNTALIWASHYGHLEIVSYLLDEGANMEARSVDGHKTALILAAYSGHSDIIVHLLRRGAAINAANERGDTSLALASYMNHPEIVSILLDRHADLQVKTKQHRYTALHLAAYKGHLDIVKLFLKNNKVIRILEAKDKSGNTAFLLAAMQGHSEVMEAILSFYAKRGNDLVPSTSTTKDPTTYLLQHDRDVMGNAALMLAVNRGHYKVAKFVLDYPSGIEMIDDANNNGETPLMRASKKGFVGIMRLLLMKGADVDVVDNNGENAFVYGIKAQMTASTDLLKEYYDLDGRGTEISKMMEKIKQEHGVNENYEL